MTEARRCRIFMLIIYSIQRPCAFIFSIIVFVPFCHGKKEFRLELAILDFSFVRTHILIGWYYIEIVDISGLPLLVNSAIVLPISYMNY